MSIAFPLVALADVLVPAVCAVCRHRLGPSTRVVCAPCETLLLPCPTRACRRCAVPLMEEADAPDCARCVAQPPAFARAAAPWLYTDHTRELVHAVKYQRRHRLGDWFAERMVHAARAQLPVESLTAVVPVPMHWLKARLRGADALRRLARRVADGLRVPCRPSALARRRWTATQTRLSPVDRARNVAGAFRAQARVVRGHVLLIDDVLTSGATAHAGEAALREAGAEAVHVLTAARTPRHDGR
jgi:predicted amidophosphoribosyltransferase